MAEMKTYELAGIGDRFAAILIDSILIIIAGGILGITVTLFAFSGGFFSIIIWGGYQWYFLTQHQGQTPGKMVMKIRTIKADGTPINGTDAVLRYVGYLINSVFPPIWLWALIDRKSQGIHDKIAGTYVVRAPKGEKANAVTIGGLMNDDKAKNDYINVGGKSKNDYL